MGVTGGPKYPCLNDDSLLFVWDPKNNKCWENGSTSLVTSIPLTGSMVNDTGAWNFSSITSSAGGLLFDGTDDYVEYSDQANWQFSSTGMSMGIWFYWDDTSQTTALFSKRKDGSVYNNASLGIMGNPWTGGADKNLTGLFVSNNSPYVQTESSFLTALDAVSVGWHHAMAVCNTVSDNAILYVDGVQKLDEALRTGGNGQAHDWMVSGGPFVIAGQWISSAIVSYGPIKLGPMYYYKRTLTAAEVLKNYNQLKDRFK